MCGAEFMLTAHMGLLCDDSPPLGIAATIKEKEIDTNKNEAEAT
jgi:hypothetical protein